MAEQGEKAKTDKAPPKAQDTGDSGEAASSSNDGKDTGGISLGGRGGILGLKAGMTQVYDDQGNAYAVTVVKTEPNVVTQVKTDEKDGYTAVQVGFLNKKESKLNQAQKGHVKKAGLKDGFSHFEEFRVSSPDLEGVTAGKVLSLGFLKEGDLVDLTATSKGKGFQGTMKRHNYGGGPKSHGASLVHRAGGSIGRHAGPARVFKNTKMAGQMGNQQVTVQNVKVFQVNVEKGIVLVHGSVPGPRSGVVTIRKAIKA